MSPNFDLYLVVSIIFFVKDIGLLYIEIEIIFKKKEMEIKIKA